MADTSTTGRSLDGIPAAEAKGRDMWELRWLVRQLPRKQKVEFWCRLGMGVFMFLVGVTEFFIGIGRSENGPGGGSCSHLVGMGLFSVCLGIFLTVAAFLLAAIRVLQNHVSGSISDGARNGLATRPGEPVG